MSNTKVHLGCWHRFIPGFLHVDLCDFPHIDFKSEISDLPFFSDGSIDLLYCSHAFEYFDRVEAIEVLCEWRRVLKPGGVIRIAVPNFQSLLQIYQDTGDDLNKILGPLFGRMEILTLSGPKTIYHKTVYDESSLIKIFLENGFGNPCHWDWRKTEHKDIDDHSQAYFPHMQKDTGLLVSLNMEFSKN